MEWSLTVQMESIYRKQTPLWMSDEIKSYYFYRIVHVDHLQDMRGRFPQSNPERMDRIFHPSTSFISPRSGKIQRMTG